MTAAYDCLSAIIKFEEGALDEEDTLALFQHLVDTGLAWSLQGSYGRMAEQLINEGLITAQAETKAVLARRRGQLEAAARRAVQFGY